MTRKRGQYPRIPCVISGCSCGATCYPPGFEIICPKHYRLVDASLKAKRRRARAILRGRGEGGSWRAAHLESMFWRKMVRQAQARAGVGHGAGLVAELRAAGL